MGTGTSAENSAPQQLRNATQQLSKRSAAAMPPTYFEHAPRVFLICPERITNMPGAYYKCARRVINMDGARHEYTTLQKAIRDHVESEDKRVNEMFTL